MHSTDKTVIIVLATVVYMIAMIVQYSSVFRYFFYQTIIVPTL